LRVAGQSGATVQYISTNSILPPLPDSWPESSIVQIDNVLEKLVNGYSQTKWVAEHLMHKANRRGIPVRIIRLGTISGQSVSSSTNSHFVSKAIIALLNYTPLDQLIFHISDSNPARRYSY
jgi:thioester reductase-like protein